jgi:hypothetical protein
LRSILYQMCIVLRQYNGYSAHTHIYLYTEYRRHRPTRLYPAARQQTDGVGGEFLLFLFLFVRRLAKELHRSRCVSPQHWALCRVVYT